MDEFFVRRFCLRTLAFLVVTFVLTSFWSYLQLNSSRFESVGLGSLGPDTKMNRFENDTTRIGSFSPLDPSAYKPGSLSKTKYLGVASSITILSLPTRLDRRRDMDTLRSLLGVPESEWKYTDAVASTDKRIRLILEWVLYMRSTFIGVEPSAPKYQFSWPDEEEINRLVKTSATVALNLWDTYPWLPPFGMDVGSDTLSVSRFSSDWNVNPPFVPCMTKDFTLPFSGVLEQSTTIPPHKILTPARVACWYSHLEAIQRFANSPGQHAETTMIFEDDVDMESDILKQLELLWADLPRHWDIIFLGHCWSNESYHPPLSPTQPHPLHNLHPSRRPRCTHAYLLSWSGARRILLHLRYPPFAFSRAIDQAFAWLVESGRIKAFSIVPSLVVQRKVRESDISGRKGGKGSKWKEKLRKGLLESVLGNDRYSD